MMGKEYRSIGETLDLIKEEFPEITISKIRFLETQGLIAPERTTNGYRKFYDHDIERLCFVLRQQREQFLPLKVIKDRITEKEPGVFVLDPSKDRFAKNHKQKSMRFENDIFGQPLAEQLKTISSSNPNSKVEGKGTLAKDNIAGQLVRKPGPVKRVAPAVTIEAGGTSGSEKPDQAAFKPLGQPLPEERAGADVTGTLLGSEKAATSKSTAVGPKDSVGKRPRLFALPTHSSLAEKLDEIKHSDDQNDEPNEPEALVDVERESKFPKNSFTARELAELGGLSLVQVEELTAFGILTPGSLRGQLIYSAADLELACLAKEFARFGLEARHLKMYKNSAEREASFLEQVILPILANKSQKARTRAELALTQLGEVGAQFRTLLLERAIEKILES